MVIFQDDPNAIEKLEEKIADLELEKTEILSRPIKPRDFSFSDEDMRSVDLTSVTTKIRKARQKIAEIQNRAESGKKLVRKPVFVNNKKRFRFEEENAKNGFMGSVNTKTLFTVGEGGKKELVTRKKSNNVFNIMNFDMNPIPKNLRKKKSKSDNIFDFMGGF